MCLYWLVLNFIQSISTNLYLVICDNVRLVSCLSPLMMLYPDHVLFLVQYSTVRYSTYGAIQYSIEYTAYPDHAVRPVPGAHLLEVEQQHRALALRALHRLRVRDQVAVLQQELLQPIRGEHWGHVTSCRAVIGRLTWMVRMLWQLQDHGLSAR